MSAVATVVETKELVQTVIFALVAGVGVTAIFSVAILGWARYTELHQESRPLAAGAAAGVTGLALLAVAAAIVIGVIVMTSK